MDAALAAAAAWNASEYVDDKGSFAVAVVTAEADCDNICGLLDAGATGCLELVVVDSW